MKVKQGVPCQFKTEADVSKFRKQLHPQVLEKMLEDEMDAHWGYEKISLSAKGMSVSDIGQERVYGGDEEYI